MTTEYRRIIKFIKYLLDNNYTFYEVMDDIFLNACDKGDLYAIQVLLNIGYEINQFYKSPLNIACINGSLEVVKLIMRNGMVVYDERDDAIRYAEKYGHTDIAEYIKDNITTIEDED